MRIRISLIILAVLLSVHSGLFAQQKKIDIELIVYNTEQLQMLYLSDFDILQTGTAERLFAIRIIKNDGTPAPRCFMTLRLLKDNEELYFAETNAFSIPDAPSTYNIENEQLSSNSFFFNLSDPETNIRIKESNTGSIFDDFQDDILASGKVPFGEYRLEVFLKNIQNIPDFSDEDVKVFFRASNPSFVQLVAPGAQAGRGFASAVYSEFPLFQWNGNGEEYQVLVFEKKQGQQSLDDILQSQPNWESERQPGVSALYPQGGEVVPLEFGRNYYWLIKMFIQTSAGEEVRKSEIWEFSLLDPANSANQQGLLAKEELLAFLRQVLGERANPIAESLADFHLNVIRFNGQEITIEELYQILNRYKGSSVEILDLLPPAGSK